MALISRPRSAHGSGAMPRTAAHHADLPSGPNTGMLKSPPMPDLARAQHASFGTLADDEVAIEVHRLVSGE